MFSHYFFSVAAAAVLSLALDASAASLTVGFDRLEADAPVDTAANYAMTMSSFTDNGDDWVRFRFDHQDNTPGITNAHLRRIFLQDRGALFWDGSDAMTLNGRFNADLSHPSVDFVDPFVTPQALPGQGQIGFSTSYMADSATPMPNQKAINLDEWGVFDLQLSSGRSFADVQSQLFDEFRVGLHVISIEVEGFPDEDWSDSFIIAPLPPAAGAGLALLTTLGVGACTSCVAVSSTWRWVTWWACRP